MRLTENQILAIREAAHLTYGPESEVWLFGSRVDDDKRGGDIDLLVRPGKSDSTVPFDERFKRRIRFLLELEKRLGERKIDVIVEDDDDPRAIVRIAHETGVRL